MVRKSNKDKILGEYSNYKRTTMTHERNLKSIIYFIGMFVCFSKKPLKDFEEKDLIGFMNDVSPKYSIRTMNDIRVHVKSFIKWHFEDYSKKFRNLNKICKTQKPGKAYNPDQMLKKEDFEKLVQFENDPVWKTFLLIYFYGGFRPKEVCELKWSDVTFAEEGVFIKTFVKKNKRTFEKFLPEPVTFYLKKLQNNNSEYVFPVRRKMKNGLPVGDIPATPKTFYQRLKKLSKRVWGKSVNPYILRHSIGTILYNRDDLKDDDVAQQMGHSVNMRNIYKNNSIEQMRERAKKIWIQPESLPPKKKQEYEKRIEELELSIELKVKKAVDNYIGKFQDDIHSYAQKMSRAIKVKAK